MLISLFLLLQRSTCLVVLSCDCSLCRPAGLGKGGPGSFWVCGSVAESLAVSYPHPRPHGEEGWEERAACGPSHGGPVGCSVPVRGRARGAAGPAMAQEGGSRDHLACDQLFRSLGVRLARRTAAL